MKPLHGCARRKSGSHTHRRGSILIVAMIFAAIIAVSLVSFIGLGNSNLRIANRALYQNAAFNLAESGMEQSMWSVNKMVASDPTAWNGWTTSGSNAWRNFTGFTFDQNATGNVRVYVQNYLGVTAPILVARATIQPHNGPIIEKWVKVSLTKRSLFANGLVAKNSITFSGNNALVDSYDSRVGSYSPAPSISNRNARGSAGSMSVTTGAFSLGNATIHGYASIGTSNYSGLNVGPHGAVGDFGATSVDYTRVTTDFSADFENISAPSTTAVALGGISNTIALPRAMDLPSPAADGKYYYSVSSISLSGSKTLSISAGYDVVITATSTVGDAVKTAGNAQIEVNPGSTLAIYAAGDIAIAGNGVANSNQPEAFQFWSTATTGQTVSISGNGQLSAVVYAPNAAVSISGGGSSGAVYGAVIGDTITLNGGAEFHYDEALAALDNENPYGIGSWEELTNASDRAGWNARMSF